MNDTGLDDLLPEADEQDIIRAAFARREAASADIDAEWRELSRLTRTRPRRPALFIAAAVAACIAVVVLLSLPQDRVDRQVAVITHMDIPGDISLTDDSGRAYDVDTAEVTLPATAFRHAYHDDGDGHSARPRLPCHTVRRHPCVAQRRERAALSVRFYVRTA